LEAPSERARIAGGKKKAATGRLLQHAALTRGVRRGDCKSCREIREQLVRNAEGSILGVPGLQREADVVFRRKQGKLVRRREWQQVDTGAKTH
jgi:hypothetical protein